MKAFSSGIKDGLPVGLGLIPSFMAVGLFLDQAGFTAPQAQLMTASVFAGPAQLAVANAFKAPSTFISIALLILSINARFFVMAAALVNSFKQVPFWRVMLGIPMLSASTFMVTKTQNSQGFEQFHYFLGAGLISYICALIATGAGFVAGTNLQFLPVDAFYMMLPLYFVSQMSTQNQERLVCFVASALIFLLLRDSIGSHALIAAAFIVALLALGLKRSSL